MVDASRSLCVVSVFGFLGVVVRSRGVFGLLVRVARCVQGAGPPRGLTEGSMW